MKTRLWRTDLEEFKVVYCEWKKDEYEVDEIFNPISRAKSVLNRKIQYRVYSREIGSKGWDLFAELETKDEVIGLLAEINVKEV